MGKNCNKSNGILSLVSVIYPIAEQRNQAKNHINVHSIARRKHIYYIFALLAIRNKLILTGIPNNRN